MPAEDPSHHDFTLIRLESIDSTNLEARRRIEAGADEPMLIVASRQTGGIGRFGRRWDSPAGGLWLTLAYPHAPLDPRLGLRASLVVVRAIRELPGAERLDVRLKWPNDVHIDGAKAAGILVELLTHAATTWALIGVGVNANNSIESLDPSLRVTAATLTGRLGAPVDLGHLELRIADALVRLLTHPPSWSDDLRDARAMLYGLGQPASVTLADATTRSGTLVDLSADGSLVLRIGDDLWTAPLGAELA